MHSDFNLVLFVLGVAIGTVMVWIARVAIGDARWLAGQFFDRCDDNPSCVPDVTEEKVLPPNLPPPPPPEQAIEGVLKAIRDQKATTTTSIPVLCYSGTALTNLQAAASECDALKAMLQDRINDSTA